MLWLFVCSGNTCRSPLAAVLARRQLDAAGRPDIAVASAGLFAAPGSPATPEAEAEAAARGLWLSGHHARSLAAADVAAASRIFAMTRSQATTLRGRFPEAAGRIMPLADHDVADPLGRGPAAYRQVGDQVETALARRIASCIPLRVAISVPMAPAGASAALTEHLHGYAAAVLDLPARDAVAAGEVVAQAVATGRADMAIVAGLAPAAAGIAANRLPGVRAVACSSRVMARQARREVDANVLCITLPAAGLGRAAGLIDEFLGARFLGGERRVAALARLREADPAGRSAGPPQGQVLPPAGNGHRPAGGRTEGEGGPLPY